MSDGVFFVCACVYLALCVCVCGGVGVLGAERQLEQKYVFQKSRAQGHVSAAAPSVHYLN